MPGTRITIIVFDHYLILVHATPSSGSSRLRLARPPIAVCLIDNIKKYDIPHVFENGMKNFSYDVWNRKRTEIRYRTAWGTRVIELSPISWSELAATSKLGVVLDALRGDAWDGCNGEFYIPNINVCTFIDK